MTLDNHREDTRPDIFAAVLDAAMATGSTPAGALDTADAFLTAEWAAWANHPRNLPPEWEADNRWRERRSTLGGGR